MFHGEDLPRPHTNQLHRQNSLPTYEEAVKNVYRTPITIVTINNNGEATDTNAHIINTQPFNVSTRVENHYPRENQPSRQISTNSSMINRTCCPDSLTFIWKYEMEHHPIKTIFIVIVTVIMLLFLVIFTAIYKLSE